MILNVMISYKWAFNLIYQITDGVSQGSILDPLPFLVFNNDFRLYILFANTGVYPDATTFRNYNIEINLKVALDS